MKTFVASYLILYGFYVTPWVLGGQISESGGALFVLAWSAYMVVKSSPDRTIITALKIVKKHSWHFAIWMVLLAILSICFAWFLVEPKSPFYMFLTTLIFGFSAWFPSITKIEKLIRECSEQVDR